MSNPLQQISIKLGCRNVHPCISQTYAHTDTLMATQRAVGVAFLFLCNLLASRWRNSQPSLQVASHSRAREHVFSSPGWVNVGLFIQRRWYSGWNAALITYLKSGPGRICSLELGPSTHDGFHLRMRADPANRLLTGRPPPPIDCATQSVTYANFSAPIQCCCSFSSSPSFSKGFWTLTTKLWILALKQRENVEMLWRGRTDTWYSPVYIFDPNEGICLFPYGISSLF